MFINNFLRLTLLATLLLIAANNQSFATKNCTSDIKNGACQSNQLGEGKLISKRQMKLGNHLISLSAGIPKKARPAVFKLIADSLKQIYKASPQGPKLASVAPNIIVRAENRYNRYVGWHNIANKPVLVISASFLFDNEPGFLTKAMTEEMKRKSDPTSPSPYIVTINGIRLVGSIYPDIKNKSFFKNVKKALEMSNKLSPDLQKYIKAVDEIRYNPSSKYFIKQGAIDGAVAYYNRVISTPEKRIIFIRRKMLYSSPLDTLLSLVHEGNHVVQHETAEKYNMKLRQGKGSKEELTYVETWHNMSRTKASRSNFVQKFECEATETEIAVLKKLGGSPRTIEGSQYLSICKGAKRKLVQWKNENYRRAKKG
ncbi:MAG: hypothetical protein OQJ97_12525 [Rhodospirillales bacterium]|nr:hypothetical protein [Rhodospirillales bacterium]